MKVRKFVARLQFIEFTLLVNVLGNFAYVGRNSEFQQSVKELKEKARELKGVKEELKVR